MAREKGLYQMTKSGLKQDKTPYHANKIFLPEPCAVVTFYGDDLSKFLSQNQEVEVVYNVNWAKSSVYITEVIACKN